jgi:hypothetical protein
MVGVAITVIVCVTGVLDPKELVEVRVTVCVPAVAKVTVGFCKADVAGAPPEKVQLQEVGVLVD